MDDFLRWGPRVHIDKSTLQGAVKPHKIAKLTQSALAQASPLYFSVASNSSTSFSNARRTSMPTRREDF